MRIEVTQQDIQCGVQGEADSCPVAIAIKRALNRTDGVYVDTNGIEVGRARVTTPDAVESFICAFDWGTKTKPFTFDLNI